jgi:hypothetical protein
MWHPDRHGNDPRMKKRAEWKIREINIAYDQLMDYAAVLKKRSLGSIPAPPIDSKSSGLKSEPYFEILWKLLLLLGRSVSQLVFGPSATKTPETIQPATDKTANPSHNSRFRKHGRRVPSEFKLVLRNAEIIRATFQNNSKKTEQRGADFLDVEKERPVPKRKLINRGRLKASNRRRAERIGRIRPVTAVSKIGKIK